MAVIPTSFAVPPEIAVAAVPDDDRVWVPQAPNVWFRPLMFNTVTGQWCNLLKVTAAGIVSRHRHPGVVFGYVLKGKWQYHEHDWVAERGHFRIPNSRGVIAGHGNINTTMGYAAIYPKDAIVKDSASPSALVSPVAASALISSLRIAVGVKARCSEPMPRWNSSGIGGFQTFSRTS